MYRVTTVNLAPGAIQADVIHETTELGEIDARHLLLLLDRLAAIDVADNERFDPHLLVSGRGARLIVRMNRGKLFAYDSRDSQSPGVEASPGEILARLDGPPVVTMSPIPSDIRPPEPTAPHRGIAIAMLVVGLALNGYTLYSVFYIVDVDKKPDVTLLTDPAELENRQHAVVGTFATGNHMGDRVIVIDAGGRVRFYEIGARGAINDTSDRYRIGRHDGQLCLTTPESGVVDVTGLDTLVYFKDVYQRTLPPSSR